MLRTQHKRHTISPSPPYPPGTHVEQNAPVESSTATALIGLPNVQGPRHYFLKAETGRFNLEGFPTSFSIGDGADKHSAGPHEHTEQNTDVSVALTGEGMASLTGHLKTI